MKKTLYISLSVVGAILVVTYWVVVFAFLPHEATSEDICSVFEIHIVDSVKRRFVQPATLEQLLKEHNRYPVGKRLENVLTEDIETVVRTYPVVREVECYKTNTGKVCMDVYQRVPKLRVATDENYYVDADRQIIPSLASMACYVPVITGRVTQRMAQEELFDFVCYIEDGFWNAQIEQIHVTPTKQIELVPRVGGHIILLGRLDGYEQKLNKLQTFYKEGFGKIGWKDYKEVDLRYKGQVICRK